VEPSLLRGTPSFNIDLNPSTIIIIMVIELRWQVGLTSCTGGPRDGKKVDLVEFHDN